ncbi:MAG: Lrp/AsnC ligand binding domain-containing protein [Methanothrix sp.]|jgi:DNA-binding Lrp family transcriptional regulator|nr:Lrp/AsnC ligand binding domain-containing protein [Methanothrix sp.]
MVLAISLIKAVPDQEKVVYRALRGMEGIKNLYHIFGNHDFFLILEAESMSSLNKLLNKIAEINSVGAIKSMLVRPTDGLCMNICELKNHACTAV